MSVKRILEEDWIDYDNRKIRDIRDGRFFACTETWEVEYLRNKIKKHHPLLSDVEINMAIQLCCKELRAPHPRKEFVVCVARRLGITME